MKLNGFYTQAGDNLLTKVMAGETQLVITKATAGSGNTDVSASILSSEKQVLNTGSTTKSGNIVTIPVTLLSASAEEDYDLSEIGVYAQDPDDGEILFHVYRTDQPVSISTDSGVTIRFYLSETVSDTAEAVVVVDPQGLITQEDLDRLLGVPNGIAILGADGRIDPKYLPILSGTEDPPETLKEGWLYLQYE